MFCCSAVVFVLFFGCCSFCKEWTTLQSVSIQFVFETCSVVLLPVFARNGELFRVHQSNLFFRHVLLFCCLSLARNGELFRVHQSNSFLRHDLLCCCSLFCKQWRTLQSASIQFVFETCSAVLLHFFARNGELFRVHQSNSLLRHVLLFSCLFLQGMENSSECINQIRFSDMFCCFAVFLGEEWRTLQSVSIQFVFETCFVVLLLFWQGIDNSSECINPIARNGELFRVHQTNSFLRHVLLLCCFFFARNGQLFRVHQSNCKEWRTL